MKTGATRVLIANRGEIAVRAARACKRLGLGSVAVFSSADRGSPHTWLADRAVCIGPAPAGQSYLDQDALLHVAMSTGCNLVYPGYGFLAENAGFAERCAAEGLVFVGPPADGIRLMGDKARARRAAAEHGVPVVPGSTDTFVDAEVALAAAADIGYPLLLKASAGGGGRGMRVVERAEEFTRLFDQASNEAREAFSDPAIYLERYFPLVRHIEVQVFADRHGNVVDLGERDCSVQRRHQKLVEESPASVLTGPERQALLEAAVGLARGVGYLGAGTVEFIFDESSREACFIEMNTRIQVEHPVTEERVGVDLVVEQLRVALGEPLSLPPRESWRAVHAMEFRLNAEDPASGFRPTPGVLGRWRPPSGPEIRIDTFVFESMRVLPFYDSMLAKLIVTGADRESAMARARHALDSLEVDGIATTAPFHRALLDDPDFRANRVSTRWVEETFLPGWNPAQSKA